MMTIRRSVIGLDLRLVGSDRGVLGLDELRIRENRKDGVDIGGARGQQDLRGVGPGGARAVQPHRDQVGPVADGKLGPGGALPTNTGGGQLSGFYMWSFTPMSEAIVQARGQGGARQVANNDFTLVSGNGGILNYHSTLILSPHAGGG